MNITPDNEFKNGIRLTAGKDGFGAWAAWALFSQEGQIWRMGYFAAGLVEAVIALVYIAAASFLYLQTTGGLIPGQEWESLLQALMDDSIPLILLAPPLYMTVCLDMKRCRSIGFSPYVGLAVPVALFLIPVDTEHLALLSSIAQLVYALILLFTPPKDAAQNPLPYYSPGKGTAVPLPPSATGYAGPQRRPVRITGWKKM